MKVRIVHIIIGVAFYTFLPRTGALSRTAAIRGHDAGAREPDLDWRVGRRLRGQSVPPHDAMADHIAPCCGNTVSSCRKRTSGRVWTEHDHAGPPRRAFSGRIFQEKFRPTP